MIRKHSLDCNTFFWGIDHHRAALRDVSIAFTCVGRFPVKDAVAYCIVMGVSTGAKEKSITAGQAVGAVIAMEAFVAGPLTKASMNPARSLGPAIASRFYTHLWIHLTAPIVGALIGGWGYRWVRVIDETPIASEDSSD